MMPTNEEININYIFALKEHLYQKMQEFLKLENSRLREQNDLYLESMFRSAATLKSCYDCNVFLKNALDESKKTISDMVIKREEERKEYEARIAHIEEEKAKIEHDLQNLKLEFNNVHEVINKDC